MTDTTFDAVATLANDITRGMVMANLPLPPQDMVLAARGGDYRAWDWVMQDSLVASCFQQRRLALVSRPWSVEPGGGSALDKRAADSLRAQLQRVGWDQVTSLMLYGVMYGYAVAEMLYARDGAEVVLDGIAVRKQRRFCFDGTGALRLRTLGEPFGMALPERKFWTFAVGADNDDDPYGVGLASWLYWPVWFRRGGLKAYLTFLDKYAQPTVVGTYPPGASEHDKDGILQAALAVASSSAIRLPEGHTLSLLEAARGGTADYAHLDEIMRDTITQVVLSQTMTTHSGSSLAQARVHEGVKLEVVKADGDLIADSFRNGPARWLTDWNYPGAAIPLVRRIVEDVPDRAAMAATDTALAGIGWRRTPESNSIVYGDGYIWAGPATVATSGGAGAPRPTDPAFAMTPVPPHGPLAAAQYAAMVAPAADAIVGGWLDQVRDVLDKSIDMSWPEVWARIAALDIDPAALGDLMAEAMITANMCGRYDIQLLMDNRL